MRNIAKPLLAFCGPSGAGKSTLAKRVMEHHPQFALSVSATTRDPRADEEDGKHYWFLSKEAFKQKITENAFLEYEEVYDGVFYGTLHEELNRIWDNGQIPFLDLDVKGAMNIMSSFGPEAFFVFIHPGGIENLEKRLQNRGSETAESLKKRLDRARYELAQADEFDHILHNVDKQQADEEVLEIVDDFLDALALTQES